MVTGGVKHISDCTQTHQMLDVTTNATRWKQSTKERNTTLPFRLVLTNPVKSFHRPLHHCKTNTVVTSNKNNPCMNKHLRGCFRSFWLLMINTVLLLMVKITAEFYAVLASRPNSSFKDNSKYIIGCVQQHTLLITPNVGCYQRCKTLEPVRAVKHVSSGRC